MKRLSALHIDNAQDFFTRRDCEKVYVSMQKTINYIAYGIATTSIKERRALWQTLPKTSTVNAREVSGVLATRLRR